MNNDLIEDIEWERDNQTPLTSVEVLRLAIRRVNKLPAVDAEPVRHGKWIYREEGLTYWWECSICSDYESKKTPYCPNCGARMDER